MRTAVSLQTVKIIVIVIVVYVVYSGDVISGDEACPRLSKFGEPAKDKNKRVYPRITLCPVSWRVFFLLSLN